MVFAAALTFTLCLQSASPQAKPRFGQAAFSPEVQADGKITFRFAAPNAKKVTLVREGFKNAPMTAENGIWSVTIDPLPTDYYVYSYLVDGVPTADPANTESKRIATGGSESIFRSSGPAIPADETNVPHGTIHRHFLPSKTFGEDRECVVYTPPGYENSKGKYPVLYLLHGFMETASAWTAAGRANFILDNLIAEKKARPMIVVMPLNYGVSNVPDRMGEQFMGNQAKNFEAMTSALLNETIPAIENIYRVDKTRKARAIMGCSMGGAESAYVALNHPEVFGWAAPLSGAFIMFPGNYDLFFPKVNPTAVPKLQLTVGKDDFLVGANKKFSQWLTTKGISNALNQTPGEHTWNVWRQNLIELAPTLFRDK